MTVVERRLEIDFSQPLSEANVANTPAGKDAGATKASVTRVDQSEELVFGEHGNAE